MWMAFLFITHFMVEKRLKLLYLVNRLTMVNSDYVPEWYILPFQHVQYTLARNQLHMDLLFEDMDKADQFLDMGADAQVSTFLMVHMQSSKLVIRRIKTEFKFMDCFYMKLFMSGKRLKAHG